MSRLRLVSTLVGLFATATVGLPTAAAVADDDTPPPTTLLAGHALVAETDHAMLANGRYELDVSSGRADVWEATPVTGSQGPDYAIAPTWWAYDQGGSFDAAHDHTELRLRRNGDLALITAHGRQLWHSGTKGSSAVRLTLHHNGHLSLHDKAGRVVWWSRTGQLQLGGGMTLGPGQRMSSKIDVGMGSTQLTLTMQRNGNLVHRCGKRVDWQTHTHVRGSSLRLDPNGALRVLGPKGHVVWSAHSGGKHEYVHFSSAYVSIDAGIHPMWGAQLRSTDCAG